MERDPQYQHLGFDMANRGHTTSYNKARYSMGRAYRGTLKPSSLIRQLLTLKISTGVASILVKVRQDLPLLAYIRLQMATPSQSQTTGHGHRRLTSRPSRRMTRSVMVLERWPCIAVAFRYPSRSRSGWMPSFFSWALSSRRPSASDSSQSICLACAEDKAARHELLSLQH